jgi:HEAT repeat protein
VSKNIDLFELVIDLNHADDLIRKAAYTRLVDLGTDAVPHLVEMFPEISGLARLTVVQALGEIGDDHAAPLLAALVTDQNPDEYLFVSSMAARSLGKIGDVSALLGLLEAERPGPRRMAATVLRNICDERAVPGLIAALGDPDPHVQQISIEALECIGTPHALAAVDAWRTNG